jgi:hypothetical protein
MPAIRIYEAALCCDTGVCGPDVDPQPRPELGLSEKSAGCCGGSTSCC